MYKCQYCDRELKSKAGQLRHESSCETRDIAEGEAAQDSLVSEENVEISMPPVATKKIKTITLEVLGGAETYYDGHPRRLTKLKGMLSATFDKAERHKIQQLILKVEDEQRKY